MCAKQRFRSAYAFVQSDQNLHLGSWKDAKFLTADQEDADQTSGMRRLIAVFVWEHMWEGSISHFIAHLPTTEIKEYRSR